MTIYPKVAAPMFGIVASDFRRVRTVAINKSPFTGKVYRSGMQDWVWTASFTYAAMKREQAASLLALVAAQDSGAGSFLAFDPDYPAPLSRYLQPGSVNGAGQVGASLVTQGWAAWLLVAKADDRIFVQVGSGYQMFVALVDVRSDGAGAATFTLDAPLRGSPANGAVVAMTPAINPALRIPMRMTGYAKPCDVAGYFRITLSGEELT